MAFEVVLPCILHGRLEGQDEHPLPSHALGELIGGESLPEAHLGVPEEVRGLVRPLVLEAGEISGRLLDSGGLLRPHLEILRAVVVIVDALADGQDGSENIIDFALEPFTGRITETPLPQVTMDIVVGERATIAPHGAFLEQDLVRQFTWSLRRVLLRDSSFDIAGSESDLEEAIV